MIDVLYEQGYEVHYLTKAAFAQLLEPNAKVFKVWTLTDKLKDVIALLKEIDFYRVIDLHNNLRSKQVKLSLSAKSYTLSKDPVGMFLLTKFNLKNGDRKHIVERFLDVIKPIGSVIKKPKTSFHFKEKSTLSAYDLPKSYLVINIGAAFYTKQMPSRLLVEFIGLYDRPIILVGGKGEQELAATIIDQCSHKQLLNTVGLLSISDSARLISKALLVVSGDSGMLHITAALDVPLVAVYGSTHPILGYTPYCSKSQYKIVQINNLNCRPCTKQGNHSCPKKHFKCMNDITSDMLIEAANQFG